MSSTTIVEPQRRCIDFGVDVGTGHARRTPDALPPQQRRARLRRRHGAVVVGPRRRITISSPRRTPDQAMQQATVNLFADMGAQPADAAARRRSGTPLQLAVDVDRHLRADLDGHVPRGRRASVPSGTRVTISGTATDNGGGAVGRRRSLGRRRHDLAPARAAPSALDATTGQPGAVGTATIRTRAIDDSGNLEVGRPRHHRQRRDRRLPVHQPVEAVGGSRRSRRRPTRNRSSSA